MQVITKWWRQLTGIDTRTPRRRFKKAWWGGWSTRVGLIAGGSLFLAAGRASSPETFVKAALVLAGFYVSIMAMASLSNYVELRDDDLLVSQMGIVTPGGPTHAGGRIPYGDIVAIRFIPRAACTFDTTARIGVGSRRCAQRSCTWSTRRSS